MTHLLLTGAGFSRNWGGWLANETFEYLLGSSHVDDLLRQRLWNGKERGLGFEDILAELQAAYESHFSPKVEQDLRNLTGAITGMFADIANAYEASNFQTPHLNSVGTIVSFLNRFDAIYTLNQDTLIEQKYTGAEPGSRFAGCVRPGFQSAGTVLDINNRRVPLWEPIASTRFTIPFGRQPYIKLHGSFDLLSDSEITLIIGGNKPANIEKHPILKWYHHIFKEDLEKDDVRLMIIGYSFNDAHINEAITNAISKGRNLRIFIVDPLGIDVLDKRKPAAPIPQPISEAPLLQAIAPVVIGASRRPLSTTFSSDQVEYEKLMRFFRPTPKSIDTIRQ